MIEPGGARSSAPVTQPNRHHPFLHYALAAAASLAPFGCTAPDTGDDGEGELRVGLWGDGASGETYSLRDAVFRVAGNSVDLEIDTAALADGTAAISTPLDAGDYELELLAGWQVLRGDVGDPNPIAVEASIDSDNPVFFAIADGLSTEVTYIFDIEGDLVPMNSGALDIDVEFDEDDGVCMPANFSEEIFASTGNYVGQGDGWQSFTATDDVSLFQVGLFWNVTFGGAFTVNIYEGVGTGGTMLFSQAYPGFGDSPPVGFDANAIVPPLVLTAGQQYTIEGVDTFGWQEAVGALPGSTSSLGDTRHKNIQLIASPCE